VDTPWRSSFESRGICDGIEVIIADPDVLVVNDVWHLVYQGSWGESYTCDIHAMVQHATSLDGHEWSRESQPAIEISNDPEAWDSEETETPSMLHSQSAVAPWLLVYAGASEDHPWGFPQYAVGLAHLF